MSDNLLQIINETTTEALVGGLIGTLLNNLFPYSSGVNSSNFITSTLEMLAQFAVNGFLVVQFYDWQASRGLGDPLTKNIVIGGISLFVAQDHLISKYVSWLKYVESVLMSSFTGVISTGKSVGSSDMSTTQNATPNFSADKPLNDPMGYSFGKQIDE